MIKSQMELRKELRLALPTAVQTAVPMVISKNGCETTTTAHDRLDKVLVFIGGFLEYELDQHATLTQLNPLTLSIYDGSPYRISTLSIGQASRTQLSLLFRRAPR